jgi:Oligosaccharide biosynthesis protein Alg14 like
MYDVHLPQVYDQQVLERRGFNIYSPITLSVFDALLGVTLTVRTTRGLQQLVVPAGEGLGHRLKEKYSTLTATNDCLQVSSNKSFGLEVWIPRLKCGMLKDVDEYLRTVTEVTCFCWIAVESPTSSRTSLLSVICGAGVQHGQLLALKGYGAAFGESELGAYGDHMFQVSILVPQMSADRQEGLEVLGVVNALKAASKRSKGRGDPKQGEGIVTRTADQSWLMSAVEQNWCIKAFFVWKAVGQVTRKSASSLVPPLEAECNASYCWAVFHRCNGTCSPYPDYLAIATKSETQWNEAENDGGAGVWWISCNDNICGFSPLCGSHRHLFHPAGGHTAEMLMLMQKLNKAKYAPRIYVVAETDSLSAIKAADREKSWLQDQQVATMYLLRFPPQGLNSFCLHVSGCHGLWYSVHSQKSWSWPIIHYINLYHLTVFGNSCFARPQRKTATGRMARCITGVYCLF